MSDKLPEVAGRSAGDVAHSIARAAAGSIPVVGAGAAELLDWFWKAPMERRREETINLLANALEELRTRGVGLAALQQDDTFFDTLAQAAKIAAQHHQEEKREALRNAIVNSGLPDAPDESKRQMFLHLIDLSTVWHLKLLNFFADPKAYLERRSLRLPPTGMSTPVSHGIEIAFTELRGQKDFSDQVWSELRQQGLVSTNPPPGIVVFSSPGHGKQTTAFGDEFLNFINAKKVDAESAGNVK